MRIVVPTPFPVGPVNVYLLPGPPVTLVDAGPAAPASQAALARGLAGHGLGLKDVQRVILTHSHPDHAGLAGRLAGDFGARVYLHPGDRHRLAPGGMGLGPRLLLLRRAGVPEPQVAALERQAESNQGFMVPVPEAQFLLPGQVVEFEGFGLKVLHTPGHSPGHLCFWGGPGAPELVCGDCLLARITPNPVLEAGEAKGPRAAAAGGVGVAPGPAGTAPGATPARFPSLERYLESLEALERLEVARAHPGHGAPFVDHRRVIAQVRRHHAVRMDRVEAALGPEPRTAWELALRMFPRVQGWEVFLAVSEVVAHLSLLGLERRVEEEECRGSVARYRRPAGQGSGLHARRENDGQEVSSHEALPAGGGAAPSGAQPG